MSEKFICLLVVVMVTVLILIWLESENMTGRRELFSTKKDKAQSIYTWFMNNIGRESYADYKQFMRNQSNIVEYEDVLGLTAKGQLTVAAVEKVI